MSAPDLIRRLKDANRITEHEAQRLFAAVLPTAAGELPRSLTEVLLGGLRQPESMVQALKAHLAPADLENIKKGLVNMAVLLDTPEAPR